MFKNLRTSTKLLLLCGVFVGALVVATYSLVAEKQIAIQFVRKELVGVQHLELLRGVYAALLKENLAAPPGASRGSAAREELDKLAAAHKADSERLDTKALERTLREAIDKLDSARDHDQQRASFVEALDAARNVASRIGDDSNLTLDPDLDSFYVQNIVVAKMPALLSEIGELRSELELAFLRASAARDPCRAPFGVGWVDPVNPRRDRAGFASIIPRRQRRPASANPRGGG